MAWAYAWGAAPVGAAMDGIEFVPMIWNARNVNPKDLATARRHSQVLLAFNEPDARNQANMTVEEALELWPKLEATGMRLGSPAPTQGEALAGGWLDQFMQGIKTHRFRVNFICVHHYSAIYSDPHAAATELADYLRRVHVLYGKPIWLTEFALANWKAPATSAQQQAFIKVAVPKLEQLAFVERYAWFAFPRFQGDGGGLANAHLSDDNYELNAAGLAYRDAK